MSIDADIDWIDCHGFLEWTGKAESRRLDHRNRLALSRTWDNNT